MSSARDTDTSGSEVTEERLPGSNLISEWSPADVEELIQATKLCDECQSLLAPTHVTEACPKCTLKSEYAECFYYSHRKDHRDLVDSVHGGCHLCKKVLEWWLLMNGSKAIEDLEVDHVTLSYTNDGSGSLCVEGNTRENLYQSKTLILSAFANAQFFAIPLHQQRNELSIVRHWATVCQGSDHEACGRYRRQSRSKPKRLLQLDPRLPDLVKLIITDSSRAYVYATLSHRWGVKPLPGPLKLSSQRTTDDDGWVSVEELQAGISESSLPQTFRDALKIARHCELQYVWIDSLCIIQDEDSDGSNPDWNEEAAKMGNIYAGGLFNIAALDAQHSGHGLFSRRSGPRILGFRHRHLPAPNEPLVIYEDLYSTFEDEIVNSELLSRGWVYQEILSTPANLFCSDSQIWWSCAHASCSQTFPLQSMGFSSLGLKSDPFEDRIRALKNRIMEHKDTWSVENWLSVLRYYLPTSVTFGMDRLVALRGIANLFRSLYPDQLQNAQYHSGLWSTDLLWQLSWARPQGLPRTLESGRERHSDDSATHTYYIPTWSPLRASNQFMRKVEFGRESYHWTALPNKVADMDTSHLDELGRAIDYSGCELYLEGVLVNMTVIPPNGHAESYENDYKGYPNGNAIKFSVQITWDNVEEEALAASGPDIQYQGLSLLSCISDNFQFWVFGILLRPLDEWEGLHPPQLPRRWVRCGSFRISNVPRQTDESFVRAIDEVQDDFQVTERYGVKWEVESVENARYQAHWHQRRLHDPILERICIV